MAKLTAAGRKRIAPKNFALSGGRYPIEDASHARNALARVAQHGTPSEQATVRAKVHAKYPDIGKSSGGLVGCHDGSSQSMAAGGSALSQASVITAPADDGCCDG